MIEQELSLLYFWDKLVLKVLASSPLVQFKTVNSIAKEKLESKGINFKNEIKVITPYIPPIEYGQPSDYISGNLLDFTKRHKKFILFYAESFATYDGKDIYGTQTIVDAFIEISKQDKETALVFCIANLGNSQNKLNTLIKLTKEAGCDNRIYWQVGAIHEMWPLLKEATLLVRPTTTDGNSVMIREALSFGLPVVTTDVTHRPEGCIVYPLGDMESLVDKVLTVTHHPYRKVYQQEDHTQKILDIYENLLNSKRKLTK